MPTIEQAGSVQPPIDQLLRQEWARVLSALVARFNDLQLAEDALQDATLIALQQWPSQGIPDHPRHWLYRVACNKTIDTLRREKKQQKKLSQLALETELNTFTDGVTTENISIDSETNGMKDDIPDERLRLIFTCCHLALSQQARVALTLRAMCGLTTHEIARAFLVTETTLAQRLVRAKKKIKAANIPYQVPPRELWPESLPSILAVIYFIFNEGYSASTGKISLRKDLCQEGLYLGQVLFDLIPDNAEIMGLLALMLIHQSRAMARSSEQADYIPLDEQDRSLWDQTLIDRGHHLLKAALDKGDLGPYQLQAAISGVHARARHFADTHWLEIALLYQKLYLLNPSPVIKLNEIVALSFVNGPEFALKALAELQQQSDALAGYQPFYAAQADFFRRSNKPDRAKVAYQKAIDLSANAAERNFLHRRLQDLD